MKSTLGAPLPKRARKGDAGYDFFMPCDMEVWWNMGSSVIDTGIAMEEGDIPEGYFMMLVPRSSLGSRGMALMNTVGVIDSGYRDTIKARLIAHAQLEAPIKLEKGERFMQGILVPFGVIPSEEPPTEERSGGLGSTGA